MFGEIIGIHWLSRRRPEHQVMSVWGQIVFARLPLKITKKSNNPTLQLDRPTASRPFRIAKHHLPSILRTLRSTLTVCRAQSMSCHLRPKYSLGRIPVVRATASTNPYGVPRAALRNVCACSTVSDRISPRSCCGVLTPSTGFSSKRRYWNACRIADLKTACA